MYHYIYRVTVLNSEKYKHHYYYGKHSTNDLNDGYRGSGTVVKKLKRNKFKLHLEILSFFDNEGDAYEFEELLIDDDMLSDPYCMNKKRGGAGKSGFFWSEEFRKSQIGRNHYTRPCRTPYGDFDSLQEAAKACGFSIRTLRRRIADEENTQYKHL